MQFRPTTLTIRNDILAENVRILRRRLSPGTRMMAVVKADAYGHGLLQMSNIALKNGADCLAVAIAEEGVELREHGVKAPILVLGGADEAAARCAVKYHLSQCLYDQGTLRVMQDEARKLDTVAHAHIKIDTGMSRVGILGDAELEKLLSRLAECKNVKLEGAFTHFAAADNDQEFTRLQNMRFQKALKRMQDDGFRPVAHAAASAALLKDESLHYDMVRPGICLYGGAFRYLCPGIRPAQTLSTRPARVHVVPAGTTVGYGRGFRAERNTVVMTLPIGYGDGYPRQLSGKACALVRGKRAPLIGNVCMDMIMLDVTEVPGACMGDEVVLLGEQGDQIITADELAMLAGTIPYEIMLGFTGRIPRRWAD